MAEDPQESATTADLTLRLIRGMRRDYAALVDRQTTTFEAVLRVQSTVNGLREDIAHLKSDIILLENQNFSRHGELLNVMRRLDESALVGR